MIKGEGRENPPHNMKHRVRIRLHHKIYDALELEALWQDRKIGTLANRIMQEEFAQLKKAWPEYCICGCDEEKSARRREAEQHPERYYIFPSLDCREKYMPSHGRGLETKGQVTLMVTDEQLEMLDALFEKESDYVRGVYSESMGKTVKSYRYQIIGMMLHNPLLQELQTQ